MSTSMTTTTTSTTTNAANGTHHHHHQEHLLSRTAALDDNNNKHVGILAMGVYTPRTFVQQSALEDHSGIAAGKYTIGLGQEALGITGDAEDVNSLCLTVVHSLLEKYDIDPMSVGRLEVGTETLVDKSKSTKTVLMQLFPNNTDMEGATVVNACYGGTAALLNAFAWCESSGWDGRYALVVAADIAAYARGPARPTSGVGAVGMLIGRDAPLSFAAPQLRATHAAHVWDFFKPDHTVEYPTVNGQLSQLCYFQALEDCYERFAQKMILAMTPAATTTATKGGVETSSSGSNGHKENGHKDDAVFDATVPDFWVFHAPYNKLVQKSYGRLFLLDARRRYQQKLGQTNNNNGKDDYEKKDETKTNHETLSEWLTKPMEETYNDKALEKALKTVSASHYETRLADANAASVVVGNTYAASVFLGLASLVDRAARRQDNALEAGKRIALFSYGSGAMATMYCLQVRDPTSQTKFTCRAMAEKMQLTERLADREEVHPGELDHALETRARMHRAGAPYSPVYPTVGRLFPGTYYLNGIDAQWQRSYSRVPLDAPVDVPKTTNGSKVYVPLAPPIVLRLAQHDAVSHPVTGKLQVMASTEEGNADQHTEARRRIACVITGTAAGLPGGDKVFSDNNMARLLAGDQCIRPLSTQAKEAMLEKNVVQLRKNADKSVEKVRVNNEETVIKLAAQLGPFCLTQAYGVPPGLAQTMDLAAQVAVAAGMEALKNAGLVSGKSNDPNEWKLPEQYRNGTGVVYASSFPAMDAAVGEVMRFLKSKTVGAAGAMRLISALRERMVQTAADGKEENGSKSAGALTDEDEAAFAHLIARCSQMSSQANEDEHAYEFDRKFLFRVLVLGNAQLAQLAGCRGPNTQTNAACAGTTQAIAMAQDMLISGRADRVVVVAGDNASGDVLLPWLGSGFRALGAATIQAAVEDAALPFDKRRSGLLLGAGGIGMVLETEMSMLARKQQPSPIGRSFDVKARLLHTQYSNSAFHGAALDRKHIGSELLRFLQDIELVHGISKAEVATHGVYFSHETCTHATSATSCAGNEVAALRFAFGDELLSKMLIVNTKGYTGHPMGVSFEDVTAVEVLLKQKVPPVPNFKEKDDYLGNLKISRGGPYACRYALRFAAGFGSQVAFALYATAQYE